MGIDQLKNFHAEKFGSNIYSELFRKPSCLMHADDSENTINRTHPNRSDRNHRVTVDYNDASEGCIQLRYRFSSVYVLNSIYWIYCSGRNKGRVPIGLYIHEDPGDRRTELRWTYHIQQYERGEKRKTNEDFKNIVAGNKAAHGGDAITDTPLNFRNFRELYGLDYRVIPSLSPKIIKTINLHARSCSICISGRLSTIRMLLLYISTKLEWIRTRVVSR